MENKEITWQDLVEANKIIKTTAIQNKEYAEVNQRVKAFRYLYPTGTITTEIVSVGDGVVIFKATASVDGKILGVGHAYEKENSTFINKTSYIENCETSAVGRCLGFVGLGIEKSIASKEEVETAMLNQDKQKQSQKQTQLQAPKAKDVKTVIECVGKAQTLEELKKIQQTAEQRGFYTEELKEGGDIYSAIMQRTLQLN